jgi:hypothetical protein
MALVVVRRMMLARRSRIRRRRGNKGGSIIRVSSLTINNPVVGRKATICPNPRKSTSRKANKPGASKA